MHPINNRSAVHSLLLTPNRKPLRSKSSFQFIHQTLSNMKKSAYKQVIQKQASELIKKQQKPLDSYLMQKQNKLATKKTYLIEQLLGSLNIVQCLKCGLNPQDLDQIQRTHLISFKPFPIQKLPSPEQNGEKRLEAQNQRYTFNLNQHCFELQQIYQKQNKGWLNPHQYFVLNSDLPCSVIKTFKALKKNPEKPLNFVQGYLQKIDCLFYVLQKQLHICPPIGPSAVMLDKQKKQYIFQLPDIVYNIIETKLSLDDMQFAYSEKQDNNPKAIKNKQKDKGSIFVICHPYYIQLYYVVTPQKNKTFWDVEMNKNQIIHKLGLKYHLPDCSKPKQILLNKDSFYYFPDQSCVISKVCLKTGKSTKLSAGYQAHPYQTKSCNFFQYNDTNITYIKQLTISEYFSQRMMKCILNTDVGGWLYSIATKYFIDIQLKRIMSCPHGTKIVCFFQRKFKQTISIQTRTNHQAYLKKQLIRIYQQKNTNNVNQQVQWMYSDILYQNTQKIFDINLLMRSQKCKCDLELMVHMSQTRKVQFHCFPYRNSNNQGNLVRGSVQIFKQVQLPLVPNNPKYRKSQQIRSMKVSPTTLLYHYPCKNVSNLFQMDYLQKIQLKNPFTLPQQQYMYQNDGIITLATQSGYTRILRLSQIDWLYSTIKMFLKNSKMPQLSLKQLIKFIYNKLEEQHKSPQFSLIVLLRDIVMVVNNLLKLILMADNGQTVNLWRIQQYGVKIYNNHEVSCQIRDLCQKLVKQHKQFISQTFLNHPFQFKKLIYYLLSSYKDNTASVFKTQFNSKQNYLSSQLLSAFSQNNKEQKDMNKKSTNNLNAILQIQKFWVKMQCKYQGCLLKTLIFNTSFSIAVADVLKQIWSLPINEIDCKVYETTLSNLDKLLIVWEMIDQDSQQYENINLNYQTGYSPQSTFAHSHPRTAKQTTNLTIVQLIQILMVCWVTKNHLPLLTIQQANKQSINYFVSYLFKSFLQDFEPQLLTYWRKLFPHYLMQNCPNLSAMAPQNIKAQKLDYWLVFFSSICGISSKQKILKVIINKFKGKEPIRQSELDVFYQIYQNQPIQKRGKYKMMQYIVFPQFIIQYLIEKKNIYFSDIKLALHSDQLLQTLATTQDHKIDSNSTQLNKNTIKKDNQPIVKAFLAQDEVNQAFEDKKMTNNAKKDDNNIFGILSAKMQIIKEVINHVPGLPFKKEGSQNNSKDSQVITY